MAVVPDCVHNGTSNLMFLKISEKVAVKKFVHNLHLHHEHERLADVFVLIGLRSF